MTGYGGEVRLGAWGGVLAPDELRAAQEAVNGASSWWGMYQAELREAGTASACRAVAANYRRWSTGPDAPRYAAALADRLTHLERIGAP